MAKRRKNATAMSTARPLPWMPIITAVAFAVRAVVAMQLGNMPLSRTPHYDSLEYLGWAKHLAAGDFHWPAPPPHGPGYPFFLAALLFVSGGSLVAVRIAQALLGALTCFLVARTAARWFGERAGIAAGAMLAVYAPMVWIDASLLAEGLLLTLTAAAVYCVASERHPALIGLLLGYAALVRPTALLLLPLLLLFGAKTWRLRALMAAVVIAVITPVTIANYRSTHAFIPIQAFGGMNFYLGNSPLRDGLPSARPGGEWERLEAQAARAGANGALAEDRYFMRATWSEIGAHPLAWAKLLAAKAVRTLESDEIRDTHSFYFFADAVPLLRFLPHFCVLFALATVGLYVVRVQQRETRFLLLYCAIAIASCTLLVTGARYRMPLVIGLAVFAGAGLERLFALARTRAWRELAPLAIGAAILGTLTLVWRHPPSHNFAEERALTADSLLREDHVDDAEAEARRALAADPNSALAWDALGAALGTRGQRDGAGAAFARAVSLNPDYGRAHIHRGSLATELGDMKTAVAELRRATQIDPRDPNAAERLARALLQAGDVRAAAGAYARAVALEPRNAAALLQLAGIEGALGRPADGLAHAQRAIALGEEGGETWLLAGMLASHARQFAVAEDALHRAESLLGQQPQVGFGWAVLRYEEGRLDEAAQLLDQIEQAAPGNPEVRRLRAAVSEGQATAPVLH
jgi:tetratricopeptide (TPR) repeat protein